MESAGSASTNETLSLWERVAEGRVRVLSYAPSLNGPHPNPLPEGEGEGFWPGTPWGVPLLAYKATALTPTLSQGERENR